MTDKELMIGDWVNLSKGNWSENRQVELIDIEMVAEGVYLAEPIPLTAEILKKNGFEKEEYGLIWKSSQNVYDINGFPRIYAWVSFWKKGCIREVEISNIDTFYKDKIKQSNTYYVHQLQHALRLCGIEKEITL